MTTTPTPLRERLLACAAKHPALWTAGEATGLMREAAAALAAAPSAPQGGTVTGWRMVDGVTVFNVKAHLPGVPDQEFIRHDDHKAMLAAAPSPASRARPEAQGDGMLPDELVPHAKEWYRLCERRFAVERITISGELAETIVETITRLAARAPSAQGERPHGRLADQACESCSPPESANASAPAAGDGRPSDAAIAREFWKRWTSTALHVEAAHELQRLHDAALTHQEPAR